MPASARHQRAPESHPQVLQTVELRLHPTVGDAVVRETKVLDLETDEGAQLLVVSCPPDLDPLVHHLDATIAWTYPLGRMECAVTTRPSRRDYGQVWLVRPAGPATRLQDRAYFRAPVSVPLSIAWVAEPPATDETAGPDGGTTDAPAEPVHHESPGVVVDLSEGGLLGIVRGQLPPVGSEVDSTIKIDGLALAHPAVVVRHVAFAGGSTGVALAFDDPSVHGDVIRRFVFAAQRRTRHTG
ncbi:PilZ domain-containing protein [Nocardioides sp. SYSU DS0651]|uniref:PilZ domain-containing protein n=1 Tax=Nocardioides sp. SYSU DS0651 TaxID=3415955 RepID=UPI003F4BB186